MGSRSSLTSQLRESLQRGLWIAGERMPSLRTIAKLHHVSVATVHNVYTELVDDGLLMALPRSGFVVTIPEQHTQATNSSLNARLASMLEDETSGHFIPLATSLTDHRLLPSKRFAKIASTIAAQPDPGYGQQSGNRTLRRQLARRYASTGMSCGPDDFIITAGASGAILLALSAVTQPGDTVLLEQPCYPGFFTLLKQLQLQPLPIPLDAIQGFDLNKLDEAFSHKGTRALLCCPHFQNPTGHLWTENARKDIIELCSKHHIILLEDDIYSDLHHTPQRPTPLACTSTDAVICGTSSRILGPDYGVGWLYTGPLATRINSNQHITRPGGFIQRMVAAILTNGLYDQHLDHIRPIYKQRVTELVTCAQTFLPAQSTIHCPQGGTTVWIELPQHIDTTRLAAGAHNAGINIAPGSLFYQNETPSHALRLNAAFWDASHVKAIETLGRLINRMH